ncbi:Outer membrane protein [hydrothermal vent metagenome]|uniref:Outer membrane protein n=1 Tax=hydrothermal vent metagenome TaxID=652676 RepID=A0A1W1CUA5_9ZZZZ
MKKILYMVSMLTFLHAVMPETEIGINIGMNSTKNSDGSEFKNPRFGLTYQNNSYVISPRVDVEYVNLKDEQANSLIKASINGVYEYENITTVSPYLLAGLGYEKVNGETKNVIESHAFVQGGAGLRIDIKDGYKARFEGKFLQILGGKDENNEAIFTAGLSIPLTYAKKAIVPKKIVNHIKIIRPIEPIIIRQPQIIREPKIINSNNNECSIKISGADFDRDGVEDRLDQCPNTPCNFSVDGYGCPIKATLQIHFANNSSEIRAYSMIKVDEFAKFLLKNRGSLVTIVGHTDSVGSASSNKNLSYRRANSVVKALLARGVSSSRIHAEGDGESMPIASNKTEEGRAKNRRIEAILNYPKDNR